MFTGGTLDLGLAWAGRQSPSQPAVELLRGRSTREERPVKGQDRLRRAFGAPLTGRSSRVKGPEAVRRLFPFAVTMPTAMCRHQLCQPQPCGRRRDNILAGRVMPAGKA